ncbi:MAG TPA: hypothetical protein VMU94_10770 [Streptosporangiaceae bacterium]|nr:hypothetical protein [Streptosporangiaceae bacterium]
MDQIWIVLGVAAAVVVAGGPLAAVVLVSIASRREESAHSLSGQAPGVTTQAARRLLGFRAERIAPLPEWAASYSGRPAPSPASQADSEVRFAHARRPLSDAGQFPARRQSQPSPVRTDQREGAGV